MFRSIRTRTIRIAYGAVAVIGFAAIAPGADAGTSTTFTYQGQLTQNGEPVSGPIDLGFQLHADAVANAPVGSPLGLPGFDLFDDDGRFTVDLDFGPGAFDGSPRWLEVSVEGTALSPRQPVMPAPYAIRALDPGLLPDDSLVGTYSNQLSLTNANNQLLGTFSGNGSGLTSLNANNITTGTLGSSLLSGTYSNAITFNNGGNVFAGSGAGLTGLNAANISVGTLSDARLSNNVVRRNIPNSFTEDNVFNGYVGIGVSPDHPLHVSGTLQDAVGQFVNHNTGGSSPGVRAETDSSLGRAVFAIANVGSGTAVYGQASGTNGRALFGSATSPTGTTFGVRTQVSSPNGYAGYFIGGRNYFSGNVGLGEVNPEHRLHVEFSSSNNAIHGENSGAGAGVFGHQTATTGIRTGTGGRSDSSAGRGIFGWATSSVGNAYGVYGQSDSNSGRAIYGRCSAPSGTTYGIYGEVNSGSGYAGYFVGPIGSANYFQRSVGIGITNPTFQLHLSANSAAKPTSSAWTVTSDERLKTNIQTIENSLDRLLALRGVTYEWIDPSRHGDMDGVYTGFIAQEVEREFPEWVGVDQDGYKNVTVIGFEGLTVEALRELREEKDAEIAALQERIARLEAIVTAVIGAEEVMP